MKKHGQEKRRVLRKLYLAVDADSDIQGSLITKLNESLFTLLIATKVNHITLGPIRVNNTSLITQRSSC